MTGKSRAYIIHHAREVAAGEVVPILPDKYEDRQAELDELLEAVAVRGAAEARLTAAIVAAVEAGIPWRYVGEALGVSAQAAHSRYRDDVPGDRQEPRRRDLPAGS